MNWAAPASPAALRYGRGMNELLPLPPTPLGRYRHHKGNLYDVVGVVCHSETLEPLVLYRPVVGDGRLWVRPHAMFFESVEVGGRWVPRFAPEPG